MVAQLTDATIQTAVNAWISDPTQAQFTNAGNNPYYGLIAGWDTSQVTDMYNLFSDQISFNGDISQWNVSAVNNMEAMFVGATTFNGDISQWDVSAVNNMWAMFLGATAFNRDISSWNVSNVTYMQYMFNGATAFNRDIRGWSVSASTVRTNMFTGATLMIEIYLAPLTPTPATQWFIIDQPILVSNICFPAGTLIATNQGTVPIEKINPEIHTIRNKPIVGITRTVTQDKYVVCFEKDSLGSNIPSQQTVMTKKHGILYKGKMRKAEGFVGNDKITKVAYNGEILYNVLMEEHDKMVVNNIICETLHPENDIAKLYKLCKNLNSEERQQLVHNYNTAYKKHLIQSRNRATKTK